MDLKILKLYELIKNRYRSLMDDKISNIL